MRPWALLLLIGTGIPSLTAQADTSLHRNRVYAEVLGAAGLGSLNYERVLWEGAPLEFGARIGVGVLHFTDFTRRFNPDLVLPIGVVACYGHRLKGEIGGGPSITSIVYPDEATFGPSRRSELQAWLSFGIRYQRADRRLLFRMAYTPIIEFGDWRHWGGVSAGFSF